MRHSGAHQIQACARSRRGRWPGIATLRGTRSSRYVARSGRTALAGGNGLMNRVIRRSFVAATLASGAMAAAFASPASASPPEFPHGVGVCMSQVAIAPELAGAERLGDVVTEFAGKSSSGSDVKLLLQDFRGDGAGGCGAPPGPGHLG